MAYSLDRDGISLTGALNTEAGPRWKAANTAATTTKPKMATPKRRTPISRSELFSEVKMGQNLNHVKTGLNRCFRGKKKSGNINSWNKILKSHLTLNCLVLELRWGWVFLERTQILSGIQFTTHLLYIFISGTYSKFARENNFLSPGVCFPQLCSSAGRRLAAGLPRQDHVYKTTDESFRFHNNMMKYVVNWIPLRIRVRSKITNPTLSFPDFLVSCQDL